MGFFIIFGIITAIVKDGTWWYSSCVCGRVGHVESIVYYYQFCHIHVVNVTPRWFIIIYPMSLFIPNYKLLPLCYNLMAYYLYYLYV